MDFIRQVGNQAEVNDGGKIRRLPFSGEGVPPKPGARVNPVRDACCCPGAVPLEPNRAREETLRSDPRRVNPPIKPSLGGYHCVPVSWLAASERTIEAVFGQTNISNPFGGRNLNLSSLVGQNIKVLVAFTHPFFFYKPPEKWLQWDLSKNTFSIITIPYKSKIYYWADFEFAQDRWSEYFSGWDDEKFWRPYTDINQLSMSKVEDYWDGRYPSDEWFKENLNTTREKAFVTLFKRKNIDFHDIRVFQPFRSKREYSDFKEHPLDAPSNGKHWVVTHRGNRVYGFNLDDPRSVVPQVIKQEYPDLTWMWCKDVVKPFFFKNTLNYNLPFQENYAKQSLFYTEAFEYALPPENQVTIEIFMKWYISPNSFKYERVP